MVVLNDGTGFKATKSQNGEKKASVSCHLPRNSSDIGMVFNWYILVTSKVRLTGFSHHRRTTELFIQQSRMI